MAIDQKDLNKDGGFWKEEEQIQQKALDHLKELKRIKVFYFHKIMPQTYDLKITGDPSAKNKNTVGDKIDDGDGKKEKDKVKAVATKGAKKGR